MKQKGKIPPAARNLAVSLPREAWDFADEERLPDDECEAAYIWEFCLGLGRTRQLEALLADRRGFKRQQGVWQKPAFQKWLLSHPFPDSSVEDSLLDEWLETAAKAFPGCLYAPALKGIHKDIVFWVFDWPEFPAMHWQQIDPEVRRSSERHFPTDGMPRWQMGAKRREAIEFGTVPGQFALTEDGIGWVSASAPGFASLERFIHGPLRGHELTTKTPWGLAGSNRWEELRMVQVNWSRSDRKLKADFADWLKANRPDDRKDLFSSDPEFSRRTTHRERLKALGAARVLGHFNNNTTKALEFAGKPENRTLPADYSSWNKLITRAAKHLGEFDKLVFG